MDNQRQGLTYPWRFISQRALDLKRTADLLQSDIASCVSCCEEFVPIPASHLFCQVCGANHSLGLRFKISECGVTTSVQAKQEWQGYEGIMHGGMIATLLDAAMTHCLFHNQIEAMTAALNVRYLAPVLCTGRIDVAAKLIRRRRLVYELSAELRVAGEIKARAVAKFMPHKNGASPDKQTSRNAHLT